MKNNFSNLAGMVGVAAISLLITLPSGAKEIVKVAKKASTQHTVVNKTGSDALNPSPKIFQECPYNKSACSVSNSDVTATPANGTTNLTPPSSSPQALPTTPGTQLPINSPTPRPGLGQPLTKPTLGNSNQNLVTLAQANGYRTLSRALRASGLDKTLTGKGPFTIFAPTDAAFAKLPKDAVRDLFKPENREVLVKILTYHVVPGQVLSTDLKGGELKSVEGGPLIVKVDGIKGVMIDDAKVIQPDIKGSNGVIHGIDQVVLPPDL